MWAEVGPRWSSHRSVGDSRKYPACGLSLARRGAWRTCLIEPVLYRSGSTPPQHRHVDPAADRRSLSLLLIEDDRADAVLVEELIADRGIRGSDRATGWSASPRHGRRHPYGDAVAEPHRQRGQVRRKGVCDLPASAWPGCLYRHWCRAGALQENRRVARQAASVSTPATTAELDSGSPCLLLPPATRHPSAQPKEPTDDTGFPRYRRPAHRR